jgi:hypothetical protein
MADEEARLVKSINDFFLRSGLTSKDQTDCYAFAKQLFPGRSVSPVSHQGYCSLTIFVGDDLVVQFRPERYRLNLQVTEAAREVYGPFAPATKHVGTISTSGLLVYSMERIRGVSLKHFRDAGTQEGLSFELRATLCKDFARFLSKAWHQEDTNQINLGVVGTSIAARLRSLSRDLPGRFRSTASSITRHLQDIEALPWVLTHGDIVAGNIMVEPLSGHLLGFVDWAEAERLPFGISLYGLEEFLGEMTTSGFQYRPDAGVLRSIFWSEMIKEIPDLRQGHILEAVELARDLGVLLWHGIAFDNGAIDRVVQEGKDVDEIYRLDAFLDRNISQLVDRASKI